MGPLFHLRDQVLLPGQAVHLPGTEGAQPREQRDRNHAQDGQGGCAAGIAGVSPECVESLLPPSRQGIFRMSWTDMGIMLEFKWYMIQMDPLSVITTSTSVNINANMFQPLSDLVSMCRK